MTQEAFIQGSAVRTDVDVPRRQGKKRERTGGTGPSVSPAAMIPYPCCPREKVVVFPGTHGSASVKCPNCGKYALFDYDSLTAQPGKTCRGALKRSRADHR